MVDVGAGTGTAALVDAGLVGVGAGTHIAAVGRAAVVGTAAVGHVRPATDREWVAALCTDVQERHGWERRQPPQR